MTEENASPESLPIYVVRLHLRIRARSPEVAYEAAWILAEAAGDATENLDETVALESCLIDRLDEVQEDLTDG